MPALKKNGVFFDAETLRLDSLRTLPMDERAEFATIRAKYDALLDAIALPAALEEAPQPAPSAEEPSESPEDEMGAVDPNAEPPEVAAATTVAPPTNEAPALPAAPASAVPAVTPPDQRKGPSIYLSDQDLLRSQSATDDGEVEQ